MISSIFSYYLIGLAAPLTAVCVLPLYPGFIAYLSNKANKKNPLTLGFVVAAGLLLFMTLLGLIFTTILKTSLTKAINIISPIAFMLLGIISILLLFNFDFSKFFKTTPLPQSNNPFLGALLYGFFFGAIIIPCNPGVIALFFSTILTSTAKSFIQGLLGFIAFGIGMATPLLILAAISSTASGAIIQFFVKHKKIINIITGIIMLAISLYYLIAVFHVFG